MQWQGAQGLIRANLPMMLRMTDLPARYRNHFLGH